MPLSRRNSNPAAPHGATDAEAPVEPRRRGRPARPPRVAVALVRQTPEERRLFEERSRLLLAAICRRRLGPHKEIEEDD